MAEDQSVDVYFSCDVETDGPIPGVNSMLSFGFAVAGRFNGERFERIDLEKYTFYRELRPISDEFDVEAVAAIGIDRETFRREGCRSGGGDERGGRLGAGDI